MAPPTSTPFVVLDSPTISYKSGTDWTILKPDDDIGSILSVIIDADSTIIQQYSRAGMSVLRLTAANYDSSHLGIYFSSHCYRVMFDVKDVPPAIVTMWNVSDGTSSENHLPLTRLCQAFQGLCFIFSLAKIRNAAIDTQEQRSEFEKRLHRYLRDSTYARHLYVPGDVKLIHP